MIALSVVTLAASLATGLSTAAAKQGSRYRAPVTGKLGVVATESPAAGRVGRQVLEHGGNAVDAAASIVFALNVARPQSCGIGGGGFMVYRSARGRTASLDFRETAPAAFVPGIFQRPGLHEDFTGHLTVGVPGTLAGMRAALRRYGTYSLRRAIRPAAKMARRGVKVTPALSKSMGENAKRLKLFPTAARQFLRNGKPYPAGSTLRQPRLAKTLRLIARRGTGVFYRGRIAKRIAAEMRNARRHRVPGDFAVLKRPDMGKYRAKWRKPLIGSFRGRRIVAMPPPTSGGVAILEMLNILERFDVKKAGMSSADSLHRIIEAQKLAFADRGEYVADPDFVRVRSDRLTAKDYAAKRAALIDPAHAKSYDPGRGPYAPSKKRGRSSGHETGSTTHVSVIDRKGNSVALTCTIEQEFGSAVVAPGTGFLLNNEMTDFGDPGTANEPRAGKRPRSSMSPTIAVQGSHPIDVTGGAGGSTIIMGTFFSLLNRIEYRQDLGHAVDSERLDAQMAPDMPISIEDARIAPGVLANLRARGHVFESEGEYSDRPKVQAAGYASSKSSTNLKLAVSDPRSERGSFAQRARRHR